MSQFTNWSNKMLVDLDAESNINCDNTTESIEPDIMVDFDNRLKLLVDSALKKKITEDVKVDTQERLNFSKIHRDLSLNIVKKNINAYDVKQSSKNSKYKTYQESLKNEVSIVDTNNNLDQHLDGILRNKLDIFAHENKPTQKILDEIARQQDIANERLNSYNNKTQALKNIIKSHDDKKKLSNPDYKSFEALCIDNEILGDNDHEIDITDKADFSTVYFKR